MNGHTNGASSLSHESDNTLNGNHHSNPEATYNGAPTHSSDVIETKFSERYTLFMEDEKVFKNMTKEHKI